jgi:hypothetical protein
MAKDNLNPTYQAYVVTKREGKDDWWTQIGSAWEHSDRLGINIVLQALPLPGPDGECKIVLRPPKADRDNDQQDNRENQREDRDSRPRTTAARTRSDRR